ncbi:efflux RND transporter periplasmic adaptor subunit [Pelomonas sp. CA6]|uniref:efflux RND transporter periplasmic adaptor subunit n=1 Tax=Pelomonas sp. CA6 TaxID=2907999 RepID=UPI001F4BCEAB|nr:efflux RND transporter periplasmic adaptor subunit [Pelomonas sp. CA6]MCH7345406.1 efflux RND transporter periplasmic adaptor subunit [Pelomonas sp. CA6]
MIRLSRKAVLWLAAAGVLAAAGWWVSRSAARAPKPSPYRSAAVDQGPITQVVMANGNLQPVISVTVGSQVSGTVAERLADFNDPVRKGQVLLRLDPTNFQARVSQAKAQLDSAEASLAFARATHERNESLLAQGFIGASQRDQSRRELAAARANVDLARAQLLSAETDLGNSVIRAPVDGVVIKRNVDVGQTVAASFQTPELFQIAKDLREMVIQTNVSEADAGLIQEGQQVRFIVDAFPSREFEGRVQQFRLNASNTQGVVSYTVIVNVANEDGMLKPGMTAQTRIVVAQREKALRLPTAALRFRPDEDELKTRGAAASAPASASSSAAAASAARGGDDDGVLSARRGSYRVFKVYTLDAERRLKAHEVTVGISNTRYTELLSGDLKAGDEVVTRRAAPERKDAP